MTRHLPRCLPGWRLLLLACGACLPLATALAVDAPAVAARPSLTVTTTAARVQDWMVTLAASGVVAPWMEASVGARITGLPLVEVRVNVGDHVRKGQLLARFDDATVHAELAQAEAALAQAQAASEQSAAAAAQADANRDRALRIRDSGAISEQEVLQYTTAAATAHAQVALTQAQVAQARAQLASARLRLDFTRVEAPDDGVISARTATVGSVSQAAGSGAELFRMIRQGRLEWRPELTAEQLAQVRLGMTAQVQLPDGRTASGKVRQLGPAMDGSTRLGLAYVDLRADSGALAGMYLSGGLLASHRAALTVPAESVVVRDGRSYVVRLAGSRCRMTAVTVGRRQGGDAEITAGLKAGEQVVVRGAGFLNDNDLVRVAAEPGAR